MIEITNKSSCCGCGACAAICGRKAIRMEPDGLGFLYPGVDKAKCVDCGLCNKVCAFIEYYERSENLSIPDVYAVRHKNMEELETSRSGAMFIAVSDWILNEGGVVYGAGYTDHFRVTHKRADKKEERDEFKGSKYVQSDTTMVFKQIFEDLKKGLYVLFTGTPCETSALRSYLSLQNAGISKLYICDLVCHGVPAPYYWRDYLTYIEKKEKKRIVDVNFRDKSISGWSGHDESFIFDDGGKRSYSHYSYVFSKKINFRLSCGICPFTNFVRPSDLTLADFWGWEKVIPTFNLDDKGVSLVLVNTSKGVELFDKIKDEVVYIKTNKEYCSQPNLQYPTKISACRDKFEMEYIRFGFLYVGRKYGNWGYKFYLRRTADKMKRIIKSCIKK